MSLLDDETLQAIRQNRFVLDCIQMSLRRQAGAPEKFVGGGSIRQTSNGELEFVIYDTHVNVTMEDIVMQGEAGEWLSAADFWTLTATDLHGRVWTAEWVDASPSAGYGLPGAKVAE